MKQLAHMLRAAQHKGDIKMPVELAPLVQDFSEISRQKKTRLRKGDEPVEIPGDIFDVVVGHEKLKKLFILSLQAPQPVHIRRQAQKKGSFALFDRNRYPLVKRPR